MRAVALAWLVAPLPSSISPALAQAASGTSEGEPDAVETAPVVVDGSVLFRVAGVSARPAAERASLIAGRIRGVGDDPSIAIDAVTTVETESSVEIRAGDLLLMIVSDRDAAVEKADRANLARLAQARIREAVTAYRHDREAGTLLRGGLYALGATALLALILLVQGTLLRRIEGALDRRYRARIHSLQFRSFPILQAEQAWSLVRRTFRGVGLFASAVWLYVYLEIVLELFPWTRSVARGLLAYVLDPLRTIGWGILAYLPKLLFLVVLALVLRYLLRLLRLFFAAVAAGTVTLSGFDPDWATPTYKIVRIVVVALALVVAYPYLPGSRSAAFKGVSLFLGVMVSLGSSSAISNVIAGYVITYRRAFRLGDRVQIGDNLGDVAETRLLVTHLRSLKNEEVVIPNSVILGSAVINYSTIARKEGLILHTTVGIGYETPWRQVEAMLLAAAERTPGLRREPPPFVLQKALGDFAVTYELNVYTDDPRAMARTYTELHRNVLDVFNEYGVQIMTPAYEGDPEQPKVVPRAHWWTTPAKPPDPAP